MADAGNEMHKVLRRLKPPQDDNLKYAACSLPPDLSFRVSREGLEREK